MARARASADSPERFYRLLGDFQRRLEAIERASVLKPWTPTWTDLTIGNGTQDGLYSTDGRLVVASLTVEFGSTTSIDASNPTATLPVTAASLYLVGAFPYGQVMLWDTGTEFYPGQVWTATTSSGQQTTHFRPMVTVSQGAGNEATAGAVSSTGPFTWTTGDRMNFWLAYLAA